MRLINHFTKGIDFRDPRLTKSPRVWWQYFWWCIHVRMPSRLFLPQWFRHWYYRRTGTPIYYWPVLPKLYTPVKRFVIRQKGEYSHRCEFTSKRGGALYGGTEGAFMNRLFERFIENISDDGD